MKMLKEIGLIGLGVMGKNIALNLSDNGLIIKAFNGSKEKLEVIKKEFSGTFEGFTDISDLANSLEKPRTILLMVPSGKATKDVIEKIKDLLDEDDLVIDGGNSFYLDSEENGLALKKENPNQTGFSDIIEEVDVKFITEGGGGLGGDPLLLVEKYFGPRIRELIPEGASSEEIAIFTNRVLNNVVDANGLRPGDSRFDRLTARFVEDFADGGRVALRGGGMDASQDDFSTSTFTPSPGDTGGEGGNLSGNNNNNNNNDGGDGGNCTSNGNFANSSNWRYAVITYGT